MWPWVFALAAGIGAGRLLGGGGGAEAGGCLLAAGALGLIAGLWRKAPWAALLGACLVCAGAGMLREASVRHRLPPESILRFADGDRRLLRVRGTVTQDPVGSAPPGGDFAPFIHRAPSIRFPLQVAQVETSQGIFPASGLLQVSLRGGEGAFLRAGTPVSALGWLTLPQPPRNPGEFDFSEYSRRQGVVGLFAASDARATGEPGLSLAQVRGQCARAAEASLAIGLHQGSSAALASALLLGARDGEGTAELWQDFQQAGLAHVLAISGANVGVFLLGIWGLGRLLSGRPGRVACVVLAVIGLFLLAVPDDTPVLRAGLMAALLTCAYGLGRPVPGIWALGAAAFALLLMRPEELFSPGFQLSFAAVGALLLFVRPIAGRVEPWFAGRLPIENTARLPAWRQAWRGLFHVAVEAVVAGVIVFLAVLPILAFHFDAVNPLAALFSLAAAPVAALLMWVGYAKIALGLVWAPLGMVLAWPVEGLATLLAWVVHAAAQVPGAQVALVKPAGLWAAAVAVGAIWRALWVWAKPQPLCGEALEQGRGHWLWRGMPSLAAGAILVVGALAVLFAEQAIAWKALRGRPGLRLHELAVGDGSCILLENRSHAVLFDCGSRTLARPGLRTAVPVLRRLGVRSLDAVIVSHADLDHFGGVLDVADAFPIKAAYLGQSVRDEAAQDADSACGILLAGLAARGIPCLPIARGWRMNLGPQAQVEALWPVAGDAHPLADNDRGVVLRASCRGREGEERALLCADLEEAGMRGLFAIEPDLRADVADLPHHGGFVKTSGQWLEKVAPRLVIQSSSRERAESDLSAQWVPLLGQAQVEHRITGEEGLVSVDLGK